MKFSSLKGPSSLLKDESGNFAMLFGLSGAALILTMGLGIDYFVGISAKARLDGAADAAALAAVNAAKAYYAANSSLPLATLVANAETQGQTVGAAAFKANVSSTVLSAPITPTFNWGSFSSQTFSVTVNWSGNVPTMFGNLVSVSKFGLSGSATAQAQLPLYEDFYVIADTSGSMGLPTSTADQLRLIASNPDNSQYTSSYPGGCQFACHYSGSNGFAYTQRSDGNGGVLIPLKLNDVAYALNNLLTTAKGAETVTNQYRVGIYTFDYGMVVRSPLSYSLTSGSQNWTAANSLASYLDNGTRSVLYATYFNSLGSQMKPYLQKPGTGMTSASTVPVIIVITDGVENHPDQSPRFSLPDTTSTSSICAYKSLGYIVAVLQIPYTAIANANPSFSNNEDGWVNYYVDQTIYANPGNGDGYKLSPGQNTVTNMQPCATSGYYFQASSKAAINSAMQQIFYQATNATRLTQ